MSDGALNVSAVPGCLTGRDLRRNPTLNPEVARRFLPLVFGVSAALIPEQPAAAESVATAVFETLAFRQKKVPRKSSVAAWLVRTTCYAAARERSRLGLRGKPDSPEGKAAHKIFKTINGLPARYTSAVLLSSFLREPDHVIAVALGTKPERVEKRNRKAVAKLNRGVRKLMPGPPRLQNFVVAPAVEVEERVLGRLSQWAPKAQKEPLVRAAISSWRWRRVGLFFKRLGATVGTIVLVLLTSGLTLKYLVEHGKLNLMMTFMRRGNQDLLKDFPALKEPARPWPAKPEEMALASRKAPANAAQLYAMTNIWTAKLKLTPEQWKAAQPLSIPPAPQLPNGKMALRNSKASRSGLAGAIGIDFPWSEGAFEFGDTRFERVGVRYRGNGTFLNSLWGDKQSYKVDLNRVKKGQKLGGITTLNFVNSIPDFTYMKDALAEKMFHELGTIAPRTSYAYLTIDVAGKFQNRPLGLYVLVEDIDADFAKDRFGIKDVPIFKPVTYDLFIDRTNDWSAYREDYDLKTKGTKEQLARVVEFSKLVSHASDEEFAQRLPEFLDLEEYAAFVAGHVLMASYDGYLSNGQNFYMYLDPRSNKFGFIPWDQDHGWGEFGYVDTAEHRENASIWKPAAYKNVFLARVLKVEAFKKVYQRKLEEALAGPFTVERLNREIDALAAVIRPAVTAESPLRRERFEIAISTNWVSGPRDAKGGGWEREGLRVPAHQMKRFIQARTKSVREQLDGKSEGVLIRGFNE